MDENKNKSLFTLGSISNKNIIIFLLSPLTFSLNNKISETYLTHYSEPFKFLSKYFGYVIGALVLYIIFSIKNESKINTTKIHKKLKKSKINKIKSKLILFLVLFLISFLDSLSTYLYSFLFKFQLFKFYSSYILPLEVLSFWILSKLIFKFTLYKHHYISIIIISSGLIIVNIISIKFDNNVIQFNILLICGLLLLQYIYPLLDILSFHLLYKKDFQLHLLLFIIGFLSIIFQFIFLIFDGFKNLYKEIFDIFNLFVFLLFALSNSITFSLLYSVFKLYKPWIYATTAVINGLISSIFNFYSDNLNSSINAIIIIIFLFLIFQCLIFNEQIICNFWGLNINTQKEIRKRAELEFSNIFGKNHDLEESIDNSNISNS